MFRHPVIKFLGLSVLYAAVIIAVFVIQFKTESVISKSLGLLNISLAQTEDEEKNLVLKNQFRVAYKSFIFNADEKNPVMGITSKDEEIPLVLHSWETPTETSVHFTFEDGSYIIFSENEDTSTGLKEFQIMGYPSTDFRELSIPYKISQNIPVEKASNTLLKMMEKKDEYHFTCFSISDDRIKFSRTEPVAHYTVHIPVDTFSFEMVKSSPLASEESFAAISRKLRDQLVTSVNTALESGRTDTLSEKDITAYVAELGLQGKYNAAIDAIPDSFKKGSKRTYFSAPYFNSLSIMNRSLIVETEKFASLVASRNMDVFKVEGISSYILREKKKTPVQNFLKLPHENGFAPTAEQAAGIINVYSDIFAEDRELAQILESAVEVCVQKLQDSCIYENDRLYLVGQERVPLEKYADLSGGTALRKLGLLRGDTTLIAAGNLLMNSVLSDSPTLPVISDMYRVLVPENHFYPHTKILGYRNSTCIWAWTCAKEIDYSLSDKDVSSINMEFPINLTHYVIFNGIHNFHSKIEIQNQMFRTDPKFETYNSSGYVYKQNDETLFVKSRHKSRNELIRLFHAQPTPPPAKRVVPEPGVSLELEKEALDDSNAE